MRSATKERTHTHTFDCLAQLCDWLGIAFTLSPAPSISLYGIISPSIRTPKTDPICMLYSQTMLLGRPIGWDLLSGTRTFKCIHILYIFDEAQFTGELDPKYIAKPNWINLDNRVRYMDCLVFASLRKMCVFTKFINNQQSNNSLITSKFH